MCIYNIESSDLFMPIYIKGDIGLDTGLQYVSTPS